MKLVLPMLLLGISTAAQAKPVWQALGRSSPENCAAALSREFGWRDTMFDELVCEDPAFALGALKLRMALPQPKASLLEVCQKTYVAQLKVGDTDIDLGGATLMHGGEVAWYFLEEVRKHAVLGGETFAASIVLNVHGSVDGVPRMDARYTLKRPVGSGDHADAVSDRPMTCRFTALSAD